MSSKNVLLRKTTRNRAEEPKTEKYSLIKSSLDAESSSSEDHLDL